VFISHAFLYETAVNLINKIIEDQNRSANFLVKNIMLSKNVYVQAKTFLEEHRGYGNDDLIARKPNWQPIAVNPQFDNYVVVIGESARRDTHQIYGFYINNTPFSASTPRIQFNDYISAGSNTIKSLRNTFLLDNVKNTNMSNNIVSLANAAGFKTYWFSNQGQFGDYDVAVTRIAKHAQKSHFYNLAYASDIRTKDTTLLPFIEEAIQEKTSSPKVIFVHLLGSHYHFCTRTDNQYDDFVINQNLSCYVQSIKNTDKLLADIYQMLQQDYKNNDKTFSMMYFSDHGLSFNPTIDINEGNNLLYSDHKANFQVPFVILGSNITTTKFIEKRRSALDFLAFYSDWLGVKDNLIETECDFFSEEECPKADWVGDLSKLFKYSNLPDEPINFFYIDK